MSATSITSSPSSSCNWIGINDTILSHKISSDNNTASFGGNDLDNLSNNVDDGLTSLTWLQNLNMCMTRLGAPTPPTPPASPVSFNFASNQTTTICKVRLQSQKERGQTTNQNHHHHHKQQQSSTKKVNNNPHHNHSNDIAIIALESSLSSQQSKSHIILTNDDHHKNNDNNNKQLQQQQQQKIDSTTTVQKTKSTESNGQSKSEKTSKNSSKKCSANRKSICPKSSSSTNNVGVGKKNSNVADSHPLTDNNNNNSHTQNSFNSHSQQPEESVDYKLNGNIKPPFSYATLICMAMKANKNKMTLSAIYKWIKENFLYYRQADPSWQNSIRHNLSLNKCFIKIARNKDEPGKGGFWKLDPIYADSLIDGIFKKRRPNSSNSNSSNNNKSQHKIENGGNSAGSIKKKPRKKRSTNMMTMANNNQNQNNNDFYIGYIEANDNHYHHQNTHQQETPPSSAESCAFKEHKMIDINELNQAINNIDSNHNHHCTYTAYSTFPSGNILDCTSAGSEVGDPNLNGFSNEICIGPNSNNESCVIETTDANDLCWNTILTDVDLSELVDPIHYSDSVAQIINPVENDNDSSMTNHSHHTHRHHHNHESNKNSDTVIESNNMELTMVDANDTNNSLLDDQQLFYHHEGQLHNLTGFVNTPAHNNQIISATPNVVTCINDTNLTVDHWNWSTFPNTVEDVSTSMQIECSNSNELILNPINQNNQQEVIMNEINLLTSDDVNNLTYVTTATANKQSTLTTINPATTTTMTQQTNNNDIIVVINDSNQQESPTNNNFDANNSVWDCKTTPNMDASGALELDNFNNLDQLHQF